MSEVSRAKIDPNSLDEGGFQRLRRELDVESLGINVLVLRPGQRNRVHIHERQEEIYLVLEGELTLVVEEEELKLAKYELARVAPSVRRQVTNPTRERVVLLALGGYGEHEGRDAKAWTTWGEEGDGKSPQDVPLPPDLSV